MFLPKTISDVLTCFFVIYAYIKYSDFTHRMFMQCSGYQHNKVGLVCKVQTSVEAVSFSFKQILLSTLQNHFFFYSQGLIVEQIRLSSLGKQPFQPKDTSKFKTSWVWRQQLRPGRNLLTMKATTVSFSMMRLCCLCSMGESIEHLNKIKWNFTHCVCYTNSRQFQHFNIY